VNELGVRVETADPAGWLFTAWDGERQVGWLEMRPREYCYDRESVYSYVEVVELVVEEFARRRGAGSLLLDAAMGMARSHGFQRVSVESTAREDAAAQKFYTAAGFKPRSTIWDVEL
jgi:GNAT superfamily N-acetyltransferase